MRLLLVTTEHESHQDSVVVYINLYLENTLVNRIYYEFSGDILPHKNNVDDFALIAVMPYAMHNGYDVHIKGAIHSELLEKMEESQVAWLRWHPDMFKCISISAEKEIASSVSTSRDAIMAYSGGLDATYALHAHVHKLLGRRSNNIVAGILIHGFDISTESVEQFLYAKKSAGKILRHYGVGQAVVKTNWRTLNAPWEQAHMFGIASVISQFSTNFARGVIASDLAYNEEILGWGSNAVSNPFFSTSSFPIDFTGGSHSRTNKAKAVAKEKTVLENLRICWEGEELGNCGKCHKCTLTKLNFLAVGVGHVPALGDAISLSQIKRLHCKDHKVLERIKRTLKEGDWLTFTAEKAALNKIASRKPGKHTIYTVFDKYKRFF